MRCVAPEVAPPSFCAIQFTEMGLQPAVAALPTWYGARTEAAPARDCGPLRHEIFRHT